MEERFKGNGKLVYAELESNDYKEVPAIEDIEELSGGIGNAEIFNSNCSIEKYNYLEIERKSIKKLERRINRFYKKIKKCPYCKQNPNISLDNGFVKVFCSTDGAIAFGGTIAEAIKEWNKYCKKTKRRKDR